MFFVLQAIGLILFIAGGLITQHAYKNIYIGGRADVFLKTLGSGEGSLYRVSLFRFVVSSESNV